MAGYTAWLHKNALVKFVSSTQRNSSGFRSSGRLRILLPALFTNMSILPNLSSVADAISAPEVGSVMSFSIGKTSTPSFSNIETAWAFFSELRPTSAILAPAFANPSAMPRPIPPLPPVTIATRPSKLNIDIMIVPLVD